MRKVLFTVAALLFMVCAASAQESVVKQAKKAKSDPEKAAEILEPALSDPTTSGDPETWKLAGDFQKSIYENENMQLYLPGGKPDTTKLYNSLAKMFEYYTKSDDLEQAMVQSGELKKAKLRDKMAESLAKVRIQLTNAGSDAYNAGDYTGALKYFGLYVDTPQNSMFDAFPEVKNDTLVPLIAVYATMAANSLKDNAAVVKYANIGKYHKEEGFRALMCLAEVYGKGEVPDSTQWLATIKEGVEKFPTQEYFVGSLMDYYIQKEQIDEALSTMDGIIAQNPGSPYYKYVKGVLQYENKDYEDAIATFNEVIALGADFQAESYSQIGNCYFFPAQEIVEENSTIPMNDPKYAPNETKIEDLYKEAAPYYEKAKELKPNDRQLWSQFLLNIYWKIDKEKYDALEKELGY